MVNTYQSNVVVIGAGPTGAHVAGSLAEAGLSVTLVDRQPQGQAGAQWINGVPEWMYEQAGLAKPPAAEIFSQDHTFTILDPSSRCRLSIKNFRLLDIDMRHLGQRLANRAANNANAKVLFDTTVHGFELDNRGRPRRAFAEMKNGKTTQISLEAALFVDASGLPALVRKNVPQLDQACTPLERENLCTAAQEVREIKDRHAAQQFLEDNKAEPGEILSWVGMAGGYSLMRIQIDHDLTQIAFLTGVRALPHLPTGAQLIQDFVRDHEAWLGARILGGQRAVPLRRPYTELVAPGVALVGDSACQVYATHGSGVGIGLIAAKMLADAVIDAAQAGDDIGSLEALWPYASGFHRRWGALLGVSDAFRRFSQEFSPDDVYELMASGMMSKGLTLDSLLQHQMRPRISELPSQLFGALSNRSVVKKMLPLLFKLPFISVAPRLYPDSPREAKAGLESYERRMQRLIDA